MDNEFIISSDNMSFFSTNIRYDITGIIHKLIEDCRDNNINDIKNILINQHSLVFKYDNLVNNNRSFVQELFTGYKIGSIFLDVLDSEIALLDISEEEIIFINKLIYDYFEYSKIYKSDNSIKEKMLSISYQINKNRIRLLTPLLGVNRSNILSILSYSSFIPEKVIHRVNDFIVVNSKPADLDNLLAVYNILFDILPNDHKLGKKATDFIIYSMLEYIGEFNLLNDERLVFQKISSIIFSLLLIVAERDSVQLYYILKEYGNILKLLNINTNKVRFYIKIKIESCKKDGTNKSNIYILNNIINNLAQEDIIIP